MVSPSPFGPETAFVKLKFRLCYAANHSVSWNQYISGNAIYTPGFDYITGVTNLLAANYSLMNGVTVNLEPYGADQWFRSYNKCLVLGSRLVMDWEKTNNGVTFIQVAPMPLSQSISNSFTSVPVPRSVNREVSYNGESSLAKTRIKSYCATKTMFPFVPASDASLIHTSTTYPNNNWVWRIAASTMGFPNNTPSSNNAVVNIMITYYCMFSQLNRQTDA